MKCEAKGGAGIMALMDQCITESAQWKRRSLDSETGKGF